MNDDQLITAISEQRHTVQMTTPVEQVIGRGRAIRARRRIPRLAAALAAAAAGAAALAVSALTPASHQPGVQEAAWTVVEHADGTVDVTIRELRDPAGLQRTLRADGIPVSVTFAGHANPACRPYRYRGGVVIAGIHPAPDVLVFRRSDLPAGAGWQIVSFASHPRHLGSFPELVVFSPLMVHASPQCTGELSRPPGSR